MKHLSHFRWAASVVFCWLVATTASAVEVDKYGNRTAEQRLRDMSAQQAAEGLEISAGARRAELNAWSTKLDALANVPSAFALSPDEIAVMDAWKKKNDQEIAKRNAEVAEHNWQVAMRNQARFDANNTAVKAIFQRIVPPGKQDISEVDPKDYITAAQVAESLVTGELYGYDISDYLTPGNQLDKRQDRARQLYLAMPPEFISDKWHLYAFRALGFRTIMTMHEYRNERSHLITGADFMGSEGQFQHLFVVLGSALSAEKYELTGPGQRELGIALFSEIVDEFNFSSQRSDSIERNIFGCIVQCTMRQTHELARCGRPHVIPLGTTGRNLTTTCTMVAPNPNSVWGAATRYFDPVEDDGKPLVMTDMWSHTWWNLAASLVLADATQYPGPWFSNIRNERRIQNTRPAPPFVKATIQQALNGWFVRNKTSAEVREVIQADCDLACDAPVRDLAPYAAWDTATRLDERAEDPRRPAWIDAVLTNLLTRAGQVEAAKRIQDATGWVDGLTVNHFNPQQRAALAALYPDLQNVTDPALVRVFAHMGIAHEDWTGLVAWLDDPRRRPTGTVGDPLYDDYQHALSEVKTTNDWLTENARSWDTVLATLDDPTRQWLEQVNHVSGPTREALVAAHLKAIVQPIPEDLNDSMRKLRWMHTLAPLAHRGSPVAAAARTAMIDLLDRNEVEYQNASPETIRAQIVWEQAKANNLDDQAAFAAVEASFVDKNDIGFLATWDGFVWLPLEPDPHLLHAAQKYVSIFPPVSAPQSHPKASSP